MRAGAAAPVVAGAVRGALLLGVRDGALDDDALLLLRTAADRAALILENGRLAREREEAAEAARRVEEDAERRRRAVDTILGIVGHDLRNPLGAACPPRSSRSAAASRAGRPAPSSGCARRRDGWGGSSRTS
jgi:signal transduction histidine kinase